MGYEKENETMVSVICTTYNHEDYIGRTLAAFTVQKTDFKVEYIIHDDCSTDGTAEIIKFYVQKYPELLKPIFEAENQYSKHVNVGKLTFERCVGKYIAWCEGDDFWLDPTKLQRQVEYMEAHPSCSICGHNTIQFNAETGVITNYSRYFEDRDLTPSEVLSRRGGTFHTSSFLIRRDVMREYYEDKPGFFTNVGLSDICIRAFALTKGTVHYMDRIMSVYRRFLPGSWTARNLSRGAIEKSWHGNLRIMNFFVNYDKYTNGCYHDEIEEYLWRYVEIMVSEKVARNVEHDVFVKLLDEARERYNENLIPYLKMIDKRYYVINGNEYWENIVKNRKDISQYVIYGRGDYGHIAFEKLKECGVIPKCFVVSSWERLNVVEEEIPVIEYDKMNYDKENTLVVMGVNTINELDIGDIDYPHVIYPFSNIRELEDT